MALALSYRTKITLAFSLLALLGVSVLSALFLHTGYRELRTSRIATSERMSGCLASNIARDVQRDSLFRVFETLSRFSDGWKPGDRPDAVVLDRDYRVYATTLRPARDFLALPAMRLGPEYARLRSLTEHYTDAVTLPSRRGYFTVTPMVQDGVRLGTVVVDFPLTSLREHAWRLFRLVLGYSVVLLGFLWLIGWLLGKRMVRPLLTLTENMRRVGQGDLSVRCEVGGSRDEFAALAQGFGEMIKGLQEKEALKAQIIKAERLAAIGRVSAGMAHEINNPLGGMLNAISTYHKHGDNPDVARKTLDLLDRGLAQLRTTVQALLVNARLEDRALTAQDLQDVRTLVEPQARRGRVHLSWDCPLEPPSGVPSSQVRQVLMNLVLNAVQATPEHGQVSVSCRTDGPALVIHVDDTGPGIPAAQREHLYEPFLEHARGSGLGLWISFQIVHGLGGSIEAADRDPGTRFSMRLPHNSRYL